MTSVEKAKPADDPETAKNKAMATVAVFEKLTTPAKCAFLARLFLKHGEELLSERERAFEEACNLASNAFRIVYDGENAHAKICYIKMIEAIRQRSKGER